MVTSRYAPMAIDGVAQEPDIVATVLQPAIDAELAIVTTLLPCNYTAIVSGVSGMTGIALAEVYGLN
jgi:hypothetical protein